MGLFSRKSKTPESEAQPRDPNAPVEGVDPLAGSPPPPPAPSKTDQRQLSRPKPSEEQKRYFGQIQREAATRSQSSIASLITQSGVVSRETLDEVMAGEEATTVKSIKDAVVKANLMEEEDFIDLLADGLHMQKVDLNKVEVTKDLLALIDKKVAREYKIFPVRFDEETDTIYVAVADPLNIQVQDDLERILRRSVVPMIARDDLIERFYKRYYEGDEITRAFQDATDQMHAAEGQGGVLDYGTVEVDEDANVPPVVRFVDLIFKHAVHDRASDIHIEPTRLGVTIRFRIDGVCHEVPSPPKRWQNAIISRLKVLSGMDLAEKRIPQDGRIKLNLGDKKLDLRVSALPAIYGESVVMRILDQSSVILGLEDVGFLPDNIDIFQSLIKSPSGVILMTGPTGSGKTTTLYSALSQLNTPERKIVTIENPVEYMLEGVNQIQVNEEVDLTFTTGLRSILRQSPDVILVGEIRDTETAEIGIRAALTGHLVFSTLHTNDAPSATTRLIDMGVKPFLVASSIQAVIAQRLLRVLCQHCKRSVACDPRELEGIGATDEQLAEGVHINEPAGCDRCSGNGYRGRTAIHEIFVMSPQLRQMVIRNEPSSRQKRVAVHNGMRTLRMDGWKKVVLGQTSYEELNRVTAADI